MFLASLNSIGQNTIEHFTLSDAAISLTKQDVIYDPSYFSIDYPNGDVPSDKGVCTDVIIRAYRKIGIDLQKEVQAFPGWGLRPSGPPLKSAAVAAPTSTATAGSEKHSRFQQTGC